MAVDRDKILQAALKLVEKKRFDKAIVEYQKLVADDPKDVRTLLKIGDLHLKLEQHVDAITTYERVGQFYSTQGFALKAIAVYKQIREIINKFVPHLEDRFGHITPRLAEIYTQLGLTSDAMAAYDEVATRYQRAGRDRDAIEVFKKLVELDPQNPLSHVRLAEAFMRVREVDSAIARFAAAAEILIKLGRRDDAIKVVERLLAHRADVKFARLAAQIYLDRGEPTDGMVALAKLQICFKENPKDLDTLSLLARAFDRLGQPAKAVEVQKEAARIARDTGKLDQFNTIVEALLARAPHDDGVRQLASMRAPVVVQQPIPPPRDMQPSIDVDVDAEVEIDEAEIDEPLPAESEQPFALKPSTPPAAAPPYWTGATAGAAPAGQPAATFDPAHRVRQLFASVDACRDARDFDTAIALLVEGIEEQPASRELREKLFDVLAESGNQPEAIRQMLAFARWLGESGDVEGAAKLLDGVLLLDPGQPEAIATLRGLGYQVPDAPAPEEDAPRPSAPYDPSAPLPSYDLEEISPGQVMPPPAPRAITSVTAVSSISPASSVGSPSSIARAPAMSQLDDPFGEAHDAPLPSFTIDEPRAAYPAAPVPSPSSPAAQLDEEALDEVEFFASNNMFDEARALLEEQLQKLPNHPLLLERLRDIEALAASAAAPANDTSGAREVPRPVPVMAAPLAHFPEASEDRSFDIAASLDALDALDAGPQQKDPDADNQVSVESVFEQFKAGVAAQISESDAATHYDLGVAYREMALYADAIKEFELAARDPGRECVCQSMIGTLYLQMGNLDAAINAFIRGLHASIKTREQELALTYEIGEAYEQLRQVDQALYYFQRVARTDPKYADPRGAIADRVRRLEPPAAKSVTRAVTSAAQPDIVDELDAALDDLLGGGKLP